MREPTLLEIFITKLAFIFGGKTVYNEFARRLHLKGAGRALDFGCGMGSVAYYLLKRPWKGHLTCLDISQRWLKECRKKLKGFSNVDFLYATAADLPQDSYDLIFCHFVLHDIPDDELETVIFSLSKALKPGGSLVFKEPLECVEKIRTIKNLIEGCGLTSRRGRISDVPLMGSSLESVYVKDNITDI